MNIVHLDRSLVDRYAPFAGAFSAIKAPEIFQQVSALYDQGEFWPGPVITINPRFEQGKAINVMAKNASQS
ncbi:MAG TPA: hypothetical protein VNI79_00480 [Sphingomicrobium sp.]|nr:hypothetical protein [Sphingomicrobium sp.]